MSRRCKERGVALMAVLFALTLLALLALPFAVSMGVGAEASARDVEQVAAEQASASVREVLLADAARSHPALDPTPMFDGLDEFPDRITLPKAFAEVEDGGRVLLGGELIDQQRLLGVDTMTPLLLANVLGTASRLGKDLAEDATEIELEDAAGLPDSGFVWFDGEVARYGQKRANTLLQVERGLFQEEGFADGKRAVGEGSLLLDYRCVLATAWPFAGRGDRTRQHRHPYRDIGEVVEIQAAGLGSFTAEEIEALRQVFTTETMAVRAATWGRPERLFSALTGGRSRTLVVKAADQLGAGSTVRITDLRTRQVEYGLVMASETQDAQSELQLPKVFLLHLLTPVLGTFPAADTVVEPLVPAPVNLNTASVQVLTAIAEQIGRAKAVQAPGADGHQTMLAPWLTRSVARDWAEQVVALRGSTGGPGQGPFTGWKDLVERAFVPRFQDASRNEKSRWILLYRNLQTGRDSSLAMGTAPICFDSGPWVHYRAASQKARSTVAAGVVGRSERIGSAVALPGFLIEQRWATQEQFEEAFVLDRRAPFWVTNPINLGALQPGDLGTDPAPRYFPHLVPAAFPDLGLGAPRFGSTDENDSAIQPGPATAPASAWGQASRGVPRAFDGFPFSDDLRGYDIKKLGPYRIANSAPLGGQGSAAAAQARGRHDRISFPFTNQNGFCERFATSFWCEADSLSTTTLFDYGDVNEDRNRMSLRAEDGHLLLEVVDEAGIDPNPADSPAGVERTAAACKVPLAEIGLPPRTPLHVSFSALSGRPSDLSLAVDGMTRGKTRYVTYLTAAVPEFDPTLANNRTTPGASGNQTYLDLQVESTEGFPTVGTLRIGLELFEYSAISGNSFRCQFRDSLGGRGARMTGRELTPSIPTDANGKPKVDIEDPMFQGTNLGIFPEHPAGALVELYGYSTTLSPDTPMMPGSTTLDGAIGGFAVARAYVTNPRDIVITPLQGNPFPIGVGIDETWSGDILLADPTPLTKGGQNDEAQEQICNAFCTTGGYALLVQDRQRWDRSVGVTTSSASFGGMELIRYTARQGNKLTGVQRAQVLPGQDGQISTDFYDGTARRFVTDFEDYALPGQNNVYWDDIPAWIPWVVPVSISVQGTNNLWDPQVTGVSEWVQLYPKGGDEVDTEWVRYDCIAQGKYLVRANRAAWDRMRYELTRSVSANTVTVGPLGPTVAPTVTTTPPWGTVTATAGYIGYTPQLESTFPQIRAARYRLRHRGDPMSDFYEPGMAATGASSHATSSHPQSNAQVTQVHRVSLLWGNFGAMTGRPGRHDRVALVQGRAAANSTPAVEWHRVNWSARRFNSDNLANNTTPDERLGAWPFQLVSFPDAVHGAYMGPPDGTQLNEPRLYDRIVKFPSGELPAVYCEAPTVGAGFGNSAPLPGVVDELEVLMQFTPVCLLDTTCSATAKEFTVNQSFHQNPMGAEWSSTPVNAGFPNGGGLCLIDNEIVAYQSYSDGTFTIATNGRGLLNTEARDHDRGARVHFLSHRPCAILSSSVGIRDNTLPVQDPGALPRFGGTLLLGRELLHYTWMRSAGTAQLEMPRWYPPGADNESTQWRGLLRGRYGTTPQPGSTGEPLISFPFRFWDRYAENSDDPELAYFQFTTNEAPVFFSTLRWRQETQDARVRVVCLARTDSREPWESELGTVPGLWQFVGSSDDNTPHRLARQASRLEVRFATRYEPGCLDLASFTAHGWKTTARVEDVRVQYEGQTRVIDERVSSR